MHFDHSSIDLATLRQRAFNGRWAVVPHDVIPLTAADPDFKVAPEIVAQLNHYLSAGYLSYAPASGLDEFKQSVAQHYHLRKQCSYHYTDVLAVNSAAQGMYLVAKYVLQANDEAIIFDPVDFLFKKSVEVVGARPVLCPVDTNTGSIDMDYLESLITPRTKLLCICNPHNPLGKVYDLATLSQLNEIAARYHLWVMSDEIWSDIVYDGQMYRSFASVSDDAAQRCFTVYGFSKTFGLAGLRIGAVLCNNKAVMTDFIGKSNFNNTIEGVSTLSQIAAAAALDQAWYWAEAFVAHLQRNRDVAYRLINQSGILQCHQAPEATYVIFPKIMNGMSSDQFAAAALERAKVAIVPGSERWFGAGAEGHIRICFSTSEQLLVEGIERILQHLR